MFIKRKLFINLIYNNILLFISLCLYLICYKNVQIDSYVRKTSAIISVKSLYALYKMIAIKQLIFYVKEIIKLSYLILPFKTIKGKQNNIQKA